MWSSSAWLTKRDSAGLSRNRNHHSGTQAADSTNSTAKVSRQSSQMSRWVTIGPPIASANGTASSALPSAVARSCGDSQCVTAPVIAGKLGPSDTPSRTRAA